MVAVRWLYGGTKGEPGRTAPDSRTRSPPGGRRGGRRAKRFPVRGFQAVITIITITINIINIIITTISIIITIITTITTTTIITIILLIIIIMYTR
jgi:hypothetical protein